MKATMLIYVPVGLLALAWIVEGIGLSLSSRKRSKGDNSEKGE